MQNLERAYNDIEYFEELMSGEGCNDINCCVINYFRYGILLDKRITIKDTIEETCIANGLMYLLYVVLDSKIRKCSKHFERIRNITLVRSYFTFGKFYFFQLYDLITELENIECSKVKELYKREDVVQFMLEAYCVRGQTNKIEELYNPSIDIVKLFDKFCLYNPPNEEALNFFCRFGNFRSEKVLRNLMKIEFYSGILRYYNYLNFSPNEELDYFSTRSLMISSCKKDKLDFLIFVIKFGPLSLDLEEGFEVARTYESKNIIDFLTNCEKNI